MTDSRTDGAPIVALVNQKGGVGKTSVALGLAAATGQAGGRALAVDTDPQGSLEELAEAAGAAIRFDFTANRDPATLHRLRGARGLYDLIVVDTPGNLVDGQGRLDPALELILAAADLVIIPCIPERPAVKPTLATAAAARSRDAAYRVLISQVDPLRRGAEDGLRKLLADAGEPVMTASIRRYVAWTQSAVEGRMLTDYRGDRSALPAQADLQRVYAEIMMLLYRAGRA